mgnify:CR=1 FL=1
MNIVIATPPGLLDNGKYLMHFPSRDDWVGEFPPGTKYYPYELAYLSTLLKRETEHSVTMLDGCMTLDGSHEYTKQIREHEPDLLIMESGHLPYETVTGVMQRVNAKESILCGPIATAFPDKVINDGWMPIKGEFEKQILDYLILGKIHHDYKEYIDLDWLPFPEDDDIHRIAYFDMACLSDGVIQMYASRGCPMACDYCTVPLYYGGHCCSRKSYRMRNPDRVCDEIESLIEKYGALVQGFFFNGETHNASRGKLKQLAQTIIDRGLNTYDFDAMCGSWGWTEDMVKLIARAGYKLLRIGIETLDEETERGIDKWQRVPHRLMQLLEWCKEYGIYVHGTTMIGLPGATQDSDMRTLDILLGMKADGYLKTMQHSPATPNPGTPFYFKAKKNGWLTSDDWNDYHWQNVVISYPEYTKEQIEAVRKAYYLLRSPIFRGNDGNIYTQVRAR